MFIILGILFGFSWQVDLEKDAIQLDLGSPIIQADIVDLDSGKQMDLNEIAGNSMIFILSPSCGICQKTTRLIGALSEDYETIVLFTGVANKVKKFLNKLEEPLDVPTFLVDPKYLKPHNITRVPAVLTYRESKLLFALHGPVDMTYYDDFLVWLAAKVKDKEG